MQSFNKLLLLTAFFISFWSCNTTKYLEENEQLIVKNEIEFDTKENLEKANKTYLALDALITPAANSTWNKIPALLYYKNEKRKLKGKKGFLVKQAEKPSYYSPKDVELSKLRMEKYLLDHGHIGSSVAATHTIKGKKTSVKYSVTLKPVHTIQSLALISDTTDIGKLINTFDRYRVIKKGDVYNKDKIDEERTRYATTLQNSGYINITEDYFYFTIDTQYTENVIDMGIHFKIPNQKEIGTRYKIGNTFLHWNNNNLGVAKDSTWIKDGLYSYGSSHLIKPKIIALTVDQDKGEYISVEKQELTLNHFLSYDLFKHVNQKYSEPYGDSLNLIDRYLDLAYASDGSTGIDLELNNRSGSFFGTSVTGSYTNKNSFKGAEKFIASITLGAEAQFNQNQSLLNSLLTELNTTYSIPRLVIPKFIKYTPSSYYIPDTFIELKNSFQNRIDSYSAIQSTLSFGYKWRETKKSNHELTLLSLSYLNIFARSANFIDIERNDRRLTLSLQDVFDIGIDYTYTFTNQDSRNNRNYSFFSIFGRTAGNTLSAVINSTNTSGDKSIFDIPFSQYAKLEFDLRHYLNINKSQLIGRIKSGIAYAYGNSEQVPYTEQFIVGGSQSLRGFQLRGLGPGDFVVVNNDVNPVRNQFFDQTGDIILEMNLEYRFPILGYLKGATFLDAGNIWLVNNDTTKPGGQFQTEDFLNQIAINTGFGLRLDVESFIVVRLDMGALLRRPYLNDGFEWTFSRPDAFTSAWLSDNIQLQLGLGYPF